MITPMIITGVLLCPPTIVVNRTDRWTVQDQKHKNIAKNRCGELYISSPCLKKFEKVEENVYRAICFAGKPK